MITPLIYLIILVWIPSSVPGFADIVKLGSQRRVKAKSKIVNDMLIPRHSTTALMCEPVFIGENGSAIWYHNGIAVANVSSHKNAILHNRIGYIEQSVPDVGFLIITNISLDDQGDYWCRREDNKKDGEISRLVVAFVEQFAPGSRPIFHPGIPSIGQTVIGHCPQTLAVPSATISWLLNGESLNSVAGHLEVMRNGSLKIRQFMPQDSGIYECVVSNFAGRTSAKLFIDVKPTSSGGYVDASGQHDDSRFSISCQTIFRNGILWFLIGCLATSCAVLLYLISAVLYLRRSNRTSTNGSQPYSGLVLRASPNLAPGFRKVIAPMSGYGRRTGSAFASQPYNNV